MKSSDLIAVLSAHPDAEVLSSKGDHSAEVIVAEPTLFCRRGDGYWEKCSVRGCEREKLHGIFIS